jgi:D-glycero-D-manno-heptose 1,7-bisphosphate phosphatase
MSLPNILPKKAIFFDRDGTLIVDKVYQSDPDALEYLPGYFELMTYLHQLPNSQKFLTFIVTNQSGIGRGLFDESAVLAIHERMNHDLLMRGLSPFTDLGFCPHLDSDHCTCRKPMPGMINQLCEKWNIDKASSLMMGDKSLDVGAGKAAGIGHNLIITVMTDSFEIKLTSVPNLFKLVEYLSAF